MATRPDGARISVRASCRKPTCALGRCLAHAVFEARRTCVRGSLAGGADDGASDAVVTKGVAGRAGDELAGAPAALRSASASCAPFPFLLRLTAPSQLQLGWPGYAAVASVMSPASC